MPDVVPESLRFIQKVGSSGLVLGGLAALGLGLAEDYVADEVHETDGDQVVPLHGRAEKGNQQLAKTR